MVHMVSTKKLVILLALTTVSSNAIYITSRSLGITYFANILMTAVTIGLVIDQELKNDLKARLGRDFNSGEFIQACVIGGFLWPISMFSWLFDIIGRIIDRKKKGS